MRYAVIILIVFALSLGCHKEDIGPGLKEYHDDFERYIDWTELVDSLAGDRWTQYNINDVNLSPNPIWIDTVIVHSGNKSVGFHASQNDPGFANVIKCNLNKNGFYFPQGETFHFSAWYYIQHPTTDYGTFFILDLGEIVEGTAEIRIMAWNENFEVERNKLGLPNLFQEQPAKLMPVNQWCHVELEVKLSQYRKGYAKMWLDGIEVINEDKIFTMPKDRGTIAWGTKGYYERIQVGITAKNGTQDLTMYVDDVDVSCE